MAPNGAKSRKRMESKGAPKPKRRRKHELLREDWEAPLGGEQKLISTAITGEQEPHQEQGANDSTTTATTDPSEEGGRGCDIISENLLTQVSTRGWIFCSCP